MSLVATLICNPANPALDSTIVDGALAVLPSPDKAEWLFNEGLARERVTYWPGAFVKRIG